ncbi:beta-1,3-glucanase family protein [Prauserella muralis]|uniref:Glycosyl hydrolase n=1 Tax=Prauserella muralis TaxID=588067 RepID=A0A2V4ANT1_9PSEU|nr:beta-1,3-glucanase family protein [Prauserella muralis]PXY22262.1 glycosyl hydrolase [Prauserella muralis]TWE27901.1 beta-1,3-glucanase [Prauserella muralis]
MLRRRTFLAGLGATALTVPAATAWARTAAPAPLSLTIVNDSGEFANDSIWVYVVGTDLVNNVQCRATPDGTAVPVSVSDNGSDGYTDYAMPLAASGATTLHLPTMSGRVYFALGSKLKFKAVADGNGRPALQYPAGWVESDPNFGVLHDFVEFTHVAPGTPDLRPGMYCNTTMVDQFSVPLAIRLDGARSQTTGTLAPGGRARIFADVAAQQDFGSLVVDDVRVIAPGHGLDAGRFRRDYFDAYIDQVWNRYRGTDLRIQTEGGGYTGHVDGSGHFVFTKDTGEATRPIPRPSTRDVFFCDGALAAPNDGLTGPVAAVLGAGFNRSILHEPGTQPGTDPAAFYRNPVTNHYARIAHSATVDGRAYGFAFDDVGGFASYVEDPQPTSITVTLTPF